MDILKGRGSSASFRTLLLDWSPGKVVAGAYGQSALSKGGGPRAFARKRSTAAFSRRLHLLWRRFCFERLGSRAFARMQVSYASGVRPLTIAEVTQRA